jgi:hypothetical protein
MLILRIRQAELALRDHRLDEAFELAQAKDLRSHRRGQDLIGRLARAMVKRGRTHLDAGRARLALIDCEKADRLGGNLPEVAALREAAASAIIAEQRHQRQRANLVVAARNHIERGQLSAGEQVLAKVSGFESRAAIIMQDLNAKRSSLEAAVKSAAAAISRDDMEAAARELADARAANIDDSRVGAMLTQITERLLKRISGAIDDGRLDLAEAQLRTLGRLHGQQAAGEQLFRAVEQCRLAWSHADRGQPHQALEILRRQAVLFLSARWIGATIKQLQQAEEAMAALRAGPLSLLSLSPHSPTEAPPAKDISQPVSFVRQSPVAREPGDVRGNMLPSKFILRVDGAGSFCVLRQALITIGSVSSAGVPDLGLIAEPGLPTATIERADEDYFIRGNTLAVNDRSTQSNKLLAGGDRIALSPRCRMVFALPVAASTSAILDLTGARYPRSEVRRVILLDRDIVIGPGNATHVRVENAPENIILHLRDGRIFCESRTPVLVNAAPMDRNSGISLDAHLQVGDVSFVISRE